ncbi:Putative metallo-dependent phosphatase [Colletotrichum destructivum]|uniref:Metallo-dependent phosphatase n=1 Tax=Colletotrichum destructivum TaxID=34406 RepID=A0AAX4IDI4_9PEZI|nr:Putative metallo-dependent phosphatase [Colletotrichum destructivum]
MGTRNTASCSWSVQRHNQLHAQEAAWLRQQVEQMERQGGNHARRLLVATHHAPCTEGTSRPEHSRNPWTSAFVTDVLDHGDWTGVKTWVLGHTHCSVDFVKNDIRLVANQRGYVLPSSMVVQGNRGSSAKTATNEFDDSFTIKM